MKRILAATAALLALSACGSQDPPTAADPTTSSPPPATSSKPAPKGPAAPTMPAAARQRTKAGAIAFTKYYWQVVNYATASLDTAQLRQLGGPDCGRCTAGVRWLASIRKVGGAIHGGTNVVTVLDAIKLGREGDAWAVEVQVRAAPGRVVDAGKLDRAFRRGTAKDLFRVQFESGSWTVSSWRML